MASLNLSTNGPSITKSYESVINAARPSGPAASSPTYAQWALFSVSAPLANAFQQDSGTKESVLKVQSTGEGELVDLIDDFSDGKIQFAFAKVKDPNTTLPKSVLIGWCGEGVPERTKGYFTSHLATVAKMLHGYHVQVTARSDRDLTPESIVQKVSDASGSKYGGGTTSEAAAAAAPPPPIASKPAFTPTQSSRAGSGSFNPLASSRLRSTGAQNTNVDEDGWGQDAPPVTRTQLEKVQSSYQPTKVDMKHLTSQKNESSTSAAVLGSNTSGGDSVIRGAYQPVGKVDIAALRKQSAQASDDRPTIVKGAYEPVGKVDIAAIRARAQPSNETTIPMVNTATPEEHEGSQTSLPARSAPFSTSERLTSLPKPKIGNSFGSGVGSFAGTKAPAPSSFGLESQKSSAAPAIGVGRTFADQGGKTPAQLWAEKKGRDRGLSGSSENAPTTGATASITSQNSGSGQWKSGYAGKSWAPVQVTRTGQSSQDPEENRPMSQGEDQAAPSVTSGGGVSTIRDRFKNAAPISVGSFGSPPTLDTSNKPNAGHGIHNGESAEEQADYSNAMPTPPPQPPRSPTPPTPPAMPGSPIRVAMPVGRGNDEDVSNAREEQLSPPPAMPVRSLAQAIPQEEELEEEANGQDPARGHAQATAAATFGDESAAHAQPGAEHSGKTAIAQYDYEKAEDNELELKEGERIVNIEMVDEDWWMGENTRGASGLFPSNYVELVEDGQQETLASDAAAAGPSTEHDTPQASAPSQGAVATALYDYEAAEENELTFPEDAKITNVEFPDEDWWSGEYNGKAGLFPAVYVKLDE